MIPQIEVVTIEVSTVQALTLRAYPQRLHRAKHLQSTNWIYGNTGFYSDQTSYLKSTIGMLEFHSPPSLQNNRNLESELKHLTSTLATKV